MVKVLLSIPGTNFYGGLYADPTDADLWFATYTDLLLNFASLSQKYGVSAIAIGTEFPILSIKYPEKWIQLIAEVRKEFSGVVTYASLVVGEFTKIKFWPQLDWVSIDAYLPLNSTADVNPPLDMMVDRAEYYYKRIKARIEELKLDNMTVVITETGATSYTGSVATPWIDYEDCSVVSSNFTAQSSMFQSIFSAINTTSGSGVFVYHADIADNQDYIGTKGWSCGFTFRNKPAYRIIADAFNDSI